MFKFDPYSLEIHADPFPAYKTLRDEYPCFWSEEANMWVLSRYEDISNALQDWETYSSSKGNLVDEFSGRAGNTLGTTDPPRHDHLRSLANLAFSRKSLDYLNGPVEELANEAIDKFIDRGSFDFIEDFSILITVGTIFKLLGLPTMDPKVVRDKVVLAVTSDPVTHTKPEENVQAFQWLVDYTGEQLDERRRVRTDDLLTGLLEAEIDGDKLTDTEVKLTSTMLIVAGVESLSSFLTLFGLNLHDYPDARKRVTEDPALTVDAIDESLRFNTSAQRFRRVLMRDVELHGQTMHKDDFVILCYGSANRDHRKFDKPDDYDIDRKPRGHLGFGAGKHICLGSNLGRLVTRVALDTLLKRIPDFHETDAERSWVTSTNFRGLTRFNLEF